MSIVERPQDSQSTMTVFFLPLVQLQTYLERGGS